MPPPDPSRAVPRRRWFGGMLALGAQLTRASAPSAIGASAACERNTPGALLGPDVRLGHRLRAPSAQSMLFCGDKCAARVVDVVVVGAGPSGLSAAWELRRRGRHDLLVLEMEREVGGTSIGRSNSTVPAPWGAHYVPLPRAHNADLVELFSEMGVLASTSPPLAKERAVVRAPEERLFAEGQYHLGLFPSALATPDDNAQFARFNAEMAAFARARDSLGRRAFTLPLEACSPDPQWTQWDQMDALTWLRQRDFNSELLHWYVRYACRDDYGLEPEQTSAWAMLFYFASRLDDTGQRSSPYLAWPEGNAAIVRHLRTRVGEERIGTAALVEEITQQNQGVVVKYWDAAASQYQIVLAQHVVVAVPRFIAARIVPALRDNSTQQQITSAFTYSPWLVANLDLSGRPRSVGVDVAWDSVIYDGTGLGFVDAQHQRLRDRGPTVWTYYRPLSEEQPAAARARLLQASHHELARQVIEDVERAHPDLSQYLTGVDVWRWGHAMIRPVPGFIWGASRRAAGESLGNIHFAHCDLSGVALFEEAFYRGVLAARGIVEGTSPSRSGGERSE